MSPGLQTVPLPNEVSLKTFGIRKYKNAAATLLRSKRNYETRQANCLVTASGLPLEILSKIFIECARLYLDCPTWSWVNLTFVCSTWRRAALECQELWCYIDFSHSRWTSLTLRRARDFPISICATVGDHNQRLINRTLQTAPQIRDIHITSSVNNIGPLIGNLKHPNPFLESLTIKVSRSENDRNIRYSKRSSQTNEPPLPSLRYLELHRSPFCLVSPRYIGLTHLSLHHLPFSERPSRQEFLSLLEKFTSLEHLTLARAFPKNIVAGNLTPGRCVRLPNLRNISLTGSVQELVNILDCVALQPAVRLRCHVDRVVDFKTNFWKLTKVIGTHFHEAAWAMPLDTLVVTGREESVRFIEDYELNPEFQQALRVRAFGADPNCIDAVFDLTIGPDPHMSHDETVVAALSAIWEALPLSHVHTLSLQSLDVVTQKSWPKLLNELRSLRIIDIGGYPPSGLLWALLLNARSHSHLEHDNTDSILLPRLDDLYIHNVDCFAGGFMVSPVAPVNSHCDLDDSRFLDVLLAYLEDRHRCGLGLRSLCISRCTHVSSEVIEELRGCVSHLLWDNRGIYKGEELDPESTAIYRSQWVSVKPTRRHFSRLKALRQLE